MMSLPLISMAKRRIMTTSEPDIYLTSGNHSWVSRINSRFRHQNRGRRRSTRLLGVAIFMLALLIPRLCQNGRFFSVNIDHAAAACQPRSNPVPSQQQCDISHLFSACGIRPRPTHILCRNQSP
jgi:hypothetical protein